MAKHRKRPYFIADFETITNPDDARVWLWGVMDIETTEVFEHGNTISGFIDYISTQSCVCYFHNLRFDGSYIIHHLLTNGFTWVKENPKMGEFTSLISSNNQWYSVTVKFPNGSRVEFRDSLKKLPMSVARVADSFKFETKKGELDYHAYRSPNHTPTDDELAYLRSDLEIIAKAIKIQLDAGATKLTVGSDALAEYKRIVGEKMFTRMFPVVPEHVDAEIRKAYRGGFTYADERFKGKRIQRAGSVYDVNSLYPYIMDSKLLPYGEPVFFPALPDDDEYPLFITSITFTAKIKPKHIPCIQIKGSFMFTETEYLEHVSEPTTLVFSNVDLELFQKHYDFEILAIHGSWGFKGVRGVFSEYISKWSKIKSESTGGMRELAKLHLNSLYGKFATNPDVTGRRPEIHDDVLKLVLGEPETREPVYTAMGVFITAYARAHTITAAQQNYDVFAYADTDSLHLFTRDKPVGVDVHPSDLGAWKHEYDFSEALFIRAKAYCEVLTDDYLHESENSYMIKIAGLPDAVRKNLTIDDLVDGAVFGGKLVQRAVAHGTVLIDTEYTLRF